MLPQLSGKPFVTDSGLETVLVFHAGVELPAFAAYPLVWDPAGAELLKGYVREHLDVARDAGLGIVVETPTWRANAVWGAQLGHDAAALDDVNRRAVALVRSVADDCPAGPPVVVSGCVGPRGDGYVAGTAMAPREAADYHRPQVESLAGAGAALVTAMTMTTVGEAAGFVDAARAVGVASVASFTVEVDGRLPDGTPLRQAVEELDDRTGGSAAYLMVNCAHPDHLVTALADGGEWLTRLRCLRVNASRMSHAELDESAVLDEGDPVELAQALAALRAALPALDVLGGCCGTDVRHVREIAKVLATT